MRRGRYVAIAGMPAIVVMGPLSAILISPVKLTDRNRPSPAVGFRTTSSLEKSLLCGGKLTLSAHDQANT